LTRADLRVEKIDGSIFSVENPITQKVFVSGVSLALAAISEPSGGVYFEGLQVKPTDSMSKPKVKISRSDLKVKDIFEGEFLSLYAMFGTEEQEPIKIVFSDTNTEASTIWTQFLDRLTTINFNHVCLANDVQSQVAELGSYCAVGDILVGPALGSQNIEPLIDTLRLARSGLIFSCPELSILICPAQAKEWAFLIRDHPTSRDIKLKYFVLQPGIPVFDAQIGVIAKEYERAVDLVAPCMATLGMEIVNFTYNDLLPRQDFHKNIHNVFLLFPSKASELAQFLSIWLRNCCPSVNIFTRQKEGSWDYFLSRISKSGGIFIIHASLIPLLGKIPHLSTAFQSHLGCTFWAIGEGSCETSLYLPFAECDPIPVGRMKFTRLFPHGGVICLMPSFLDSQPQKANFFLEWARKKLERSTPGTWKLFGCHNLAQFLLHLANQRASERDDLLSIKNSNTEDLAANAGLSFEDCQMRFTNYEIVDSIVQSDLIRNLGQEDAENEANLAVVSAYENIDPCNEKALVEAFAGWSILHVNLFRKFYVLGTDGNSGQIGSIILSEDLVSGQAKPTHAEIQAQAEKLVTTTATSEAIHSTSNENCWKEDSVVRVEEKLGDEMHSTFTPSNVKMGSLTQEKCPAKEAQLVHPPVVGQARFHEAIADLQRAKIHLELAGNVEYAAVQNNFSTNQLPESTQDCRQDGVQSNDERITATVESLVALNSAPQDIANHTLTVDGANAQQDGVEPTTEWYAKLQAEGKGWEHISVMGWESCFKLLSIKGTKD
jgi:hypothetical protein